MGVCTVRRLLVAAVAVIPLAFAQAAEATQIHYTFSDLGTARGKDPQPADINNAGVIAGTFYPAYPHPARAFVFRGGRYRNLGSLTNAQGEGMSMATAMNETGLIAGASVPYIPQECTDCTDWQAVLFRGGRIVDYGYGPRDYTIPAALNEHGAWAGLSAWEKSDESVAVRSLAGVKIDALPSFPDQSSGRATGIEADGQLVGDIDFSLNQQTGYYRHHAFIFRNGRYTDLGSLGGKDGLSDAAAGSAGRFIAGSTSLGPAPAGGPQHAYLYRDGMRDLGTLRGDTQSGATDVNASGEVIGWSRGDGPNTAFLFAHGRMWNLSVRAPRSWRDLSVSAINSGGQIVGSATIKKQTHMVLLSPTCTVKGTRRADRLHGTRGADVICAGKGNDTIYPGGGNDIVIGGPGIDTVNYSTAAHAVTVDLSLGRADGAGFDHLGGVENAYGSQRGDLLIGNSVRNVLSGAWGADEVRGEDNDDILNGGAGVDALDGGAGTDRCRTGPDGGSTSHCE
jgi:probable HAF family extracellular repeat protein